MQTLNLEKKHSGYYSKRVGNIQVVVSKYSQGWEGTIHNLHFVQCKYIYYNYLLI